MLVKVFDMFTQVDNTLHRANGGLGIGLTLVKNIIEMHEGTVEARSQGHDLGAEFIVRLPLLNQGYSPASDASASKCILPLPQLSILVVDDVNASAKTLALMLRAIGQVPRLCFDGRSAIEAAMQDPPDVIFLDIGMPEMDGYEVARQLRESDQLGDTLFVALTGYGQEEDRARAKEAGFHHHLVKPASMDSLRSLLSSVPTKYLN